MRFPLADELFKRSRLNKENDEACWAAAWGRLPRHSQQATVLQPHTKWQTYRWIDSMTEFSLLYNIHRRKTTHFYVALSTTDRSIQVTKRGLNMELNLPNFSSTHYSIIAGNLKGFSKHLLTDTRTKKIDGIWRQNCSAFLIITSHVW